jgi:membrane protein required for colicin V production
MTSIDILLMVVLLIGIVNGFRNGFFVELASLISVMLGIYVAIRFSFLTKSYLEKEVDWNPTVVQVVAFAITFLLVIVVVSSMAKIFTSVANFASLGFINNFFGALLGLIRTILVVSVLLNLMQKAQLETYFLSEQNKRNSKVYGFVQEVSKEVYPSIADWFAVFQKDDFKLADDRQ